MSITQDTYLPTEEDLTVQEVNVSGPVLKAGAFHLGKACEFENNEFVLCRTETGDPRACIDEGKAVTDCTLNFFRQVKKTCYGEFMQYANCLDKSSTNQSFLPCRNTQAVYDKCMLDNLDMKRPPYDYFARVHVHETKKARAGCGDRIDYPDATPHLPEDMDKPRAKYGARYLWMW